MPSKEQLKILKQGAKVWNAWRESNPTAQVDLERADLFAANLHKANLSRADLRAANLSSARLREAYLSGANLSWANLPAAHLRGANLKRANMAQSNLSGAHLNAANLSEANLREADLSGADLRAANLTPGIYVPTLERTRVDLSRANLSRAILSRAHMSRAILARANLTHANLTDANLREADLRSADLSAANLTHAGLISTEFRRTILANADLTGALLSDTTFTDCDLSTAKGLEAVKHLGPSTIGIDTLYKSRGKIPDSFLRGCGVPEDVIEHLLPLIRTSSPIQFFSCFISYSSKDDEFARKLHGRMRQAHIRVWFAPDDAKGGRKLHEQLFEAIQIHDRLLLVLSENSMQSEWVMTEIRKAREVERKEGRRKLFPIRLCTFAELRDWTCFDADSGKDLAIEVREYFIPDFSNWKDHDTFEKEFEKLRRDLKADQRLRPTA